MKIYTRIAIWLTICDWVVAHCQRQFASRLASEYKGLYEYLFRMFLFKYNTRYRNVFILKVKYCTKPPKFIPIWNDVKIQILKFIHVTTYWRPPLINIWNILLQPLQVNVTGQKTLFLWIILLFEFSAANGVLLYCLEEGLTFRWKQAIFVS